MPIKELVLLVVLAIVQSAIFLDLDHCRSDPLVISIRTSTSSCYHELTDTDQD